MNAISYPYSNVLRRTLIIALAICLLAFGVCHALLTYSQTVYAQPARVTTADAKPDVPAASSTPHSPNESPLLANKPSTNIQHAVKDAVGTSTPACQANNSYHIPSSLNLSSASAGLTQQIDSPAYYDVYGATPLIIAQQLNSCAPNFAGSVTTAHYLAYTSYQLSWQYDIYNNGAGLCNLTNIRVGQHSSQLFPRWNSAAAAQAGTTAKWNSFITSLRGHEAGHLALNAQYGQKLLSDLQAVPAIPCATVTTTVNAVVNSDVAALDAAHLLHDTSTGYGASEGAVW